LKREPYACPVTIKLEKMNPFKTIIVKEVNLLDGGDEKTVFRFKVNNMGDVESVSDGPYRNLIKKKR